MTGDSAGSETRGYSLRREGAVGVSVAAFYGPSWTRYSRFKNRYIPVWACLHILIISYSSP
jgi:hypothetical protein